MKQGWFPTPMLRSVFGEPTGTSVKFATMMHDAVQSYLEDHDMTSFNIQAIALEGEGQVDGRVDKLYAQLVARDAWVEALAKADVVFLATHSQGSVVSTHLLARMIERGLVKGPRIHLLAMCGIAQGPCQSPLYLFRTLGRMGELTHERGHSRLPQSVVRSLAVLQLRRVGPRARAVRVPGSQQRRGQKVSREVRLPFLSVVHCVPLCTDLNAPPPASGSFSHPASR